MKYRDRIECNPDVLLGKPVIKGTRIPVELILRRLAEGRTPEEIMRDYPGLEKEDILACLEYSAEVIAREEIIVP